MARRRLLSDEQLAPFWAWACDERAIVRHYTLSRADLDLIDKKRAGANRLGFAVLMCAMRFPGRILDVHEAPPAEVLAFIAEQVAVPASELAAYRKRPTNRREHIAELMQNLGCRAFDTDAARELSAVAVSLAQGMPRLERLVAAVIEEARKRHILLPAPHAIDLLCQQARVRSERLLHQALTTGLSEAARKSLDGLLEIAPEATSTRLTDVLLYHDMGLAIEEHYTDTGGVSDHVFGLCHLFGFRFAPRMRDIKERKLYLLPDQKAPASLKPLVGGVIDTEHIIAHWDQLLRLATSIRTGTTTSSAMLKKLSAYPRQNGLAKALREIGRIERTLFTLDWIKNPDLRRRAHLGLNKGEAHNALARAIYFCRLGEMRDRSFENQFFRASGLNLLVAAIILWNTKYLDVAYPELRRQGRPINEDLLRHVAPLGWEHIGLTGDYVWSTADQPPAGTLRPLRQRQSLLAA